MKKPKRPLFRLSPISQILVLALSASPVWAVSTDQNTLPQQIASITVPKKWMPRVSITGEYGNYGIGQADLFTPVWSNDLGLVFFDLRATATAQSTQEYNGALGFRTIVGNTDKAIVGAHIWDDRKHTKYGNFFNQGTLGLEYFGNIYSVTSNIYVPYGDKKQIAYSTGTTPFIEGHTVGYFENTAYETAIPGIDVEVGKQDIFDRHLRVYADYYHFGEGNDNTQMNGGRARSEYIIENKWLHHMDSDVMITASVQYDNVEHAAGFIGLRVNIGRDYEPTDALVGRLEEYIIRDNNIVTPVPSSLSSSIRVTDPDTFIFVDNTKPAGGDGTKEHPYNTEAAAITGSQSGNIIYTFQGAGNYTMPSGGLNLNPNLVFFGSGSNYVFNNVVVIPATSAPVLNGRINLANNDTINGFTISGQGSSENIGIYGNTGISNVSIINTTVQDFTGTNANGADGTTTGGNGGTGGAAYGIFLANSNHVLLSNVTVNNILGGDANGGNANGVVTTGGNGGTGGRATGIALTNATDILLSDVTVNNIRGGSGNGGSATSTIATSQGGNGAFGSAAYGIDLNTSSIVTLSHVAVNNIFGGDANGGSATSGNGTGIKGGNGGAHGGYSYGINLNNSSTLVLDEISVANIKGGNINSGMATGSSALINGGSPTSFGRGGVSVGITLFNASNVTLTNTSVTNIIGGDANSGNATSSYSSNTQTYNGNSGGNTLGINLANVTGLTINNVSVNTVTGGNANAGDASGNTVNATGGNGGIGGNATGILGLSSLPAGVTITGVTGGTATGGTASGGSSTNTQGTNGTAGTANDIVP